jgi:hypothetical protein
MVVSHAARYPTRHGLAMPQTRMRGAPDSPSTAVVSGAGYLRVTRSRTRVCYYRTGAATLKRWGALPRCRKLVGSVATRRALLHQWPGGRYDAMENRTKAVHWYQAALRCDAYCYEVIAALPHLRRDRAHPSHICAGPGLAPAHICAGTGCAGVGPVGDQPHALGGRRGRAGQPGKSGPTAAREYCEYREYCVCAQYPAALRPLR